LLVAIVPPFDSIPLHPFPTHSAHITLYYNDDINNLSLLRPGQVVYNTSTIHDAEVGFILSSLGCLLNVLLEFILL
jgi:hypothetical protein